MKEVFHRLAKQKAGVIEAGQLRPDPVPLLLALPPQHEEQGIKTDSPNQAREDPRIDDLFNR